MRLITRSDASLTVALIAATVILFQQPLRRVLDAAQAIESQYHLDLVPALLVLTAAFMFHLSRRRQQAKAEAAASAAEAVKARAQSGELEHLIAFGQALANALDRATLQQVVWKHLPAFARNHELWVVIRKDNGWELFNEGGVAHCRSIDTIERLANNALMGGAIAAGDPHDACFPMLAAGTAVGVLGVSQSQPLTELQQKMLGAAAPLIAIAIKNMKLFIQTRDLSLRDALTGCFNRAYGLEALDLEMRRSRRSGAPLSVLMFDIDNFKTINDEFGHLRGDELLAELGAQLARLVRTTDVRCRYGGDEFLIVLPDTAVAGAKQAAEALRHKISQVRLTAGDRSVAITISVGVAGATPGEEDAKELIDRADEALYKAKRAGRNRYCVALPPGTSTHAVTVPQLVHVK